MIKRSAYVLMWRVLGMALLFLVHTSISKTLGAKGYGVFSVALTISAIAAIIAPFGWPTTLIRLISDYRESSEFSLLKGAFIRAGQTTLILSVLLILLLVFISMFAKPDFGRGIILGALLVPVSSFIYLRQRSLQGLNAIFASMIPDEVLLPAIMLCAIMLVSVNSAEIATAYYFASAVIVSLVSIYLLRGHLASLISGVEPSYKTRYWFSIAMPIMIGAVAHLSLDRVDILILGAIRTPEEVGLYAAANRLSTLVVLGMGVVATVITPILASQYTKRQFGRFRQGLRKAALLSTFSGIIVALPLLLFPALILSVFGMEFQRADSVLQILTIGQIVSASVGPVGAALVLSGRQNFFAKATLIAALGKTIASILVAPQFGMIGVSVISALVVSALNIILFVSAYRIK